MSTEHFPRNISEKRVPEFDDAYVQKRFDKMVALYDVTEAQEPTYERMSVYEGAKKLGKEALKAAEVTIKPSAAIALEEEFRKIEPDRLDRMSDDQILEQFYHPDLFDMSPDNTQRSNDIQTQPIEFREDAPLTLPNTTDQQRVVHSSHLEVREKSPGEQLDEIKNNSLESLAEIIAAQPDEREYNMEATAADNELEKVSQNLINLTLEGERHISNVTKREATELDSDILTVPTKLSDSDITTILNKLPKNRKTILPIYRAYLRLRNQADHANGPERQSFLDNATLFRDLASRLMLSQSPGWNDIYVDELRQWYAAEFPELNKV